jgi:hypothetical protein
VDEKARKEATNQQVINNFTKCGVKNEITAIKSNVDVSIQKHIQISKINYAFLFQLKREKAQIYHGLFKKAFF